MPSPGDHILVALIAIVYPLYSTLTWFRRGRPRLEIGGSRARIHFYREAMIELWLLAAVAFWWWIWVGRTVTDIGLGVPGGWAFWIGAVVVVAFGVVLQRQVAMTRASAEVRAQIRKQLSDTVALIIPRDKQERRVFIGLSLTAGICEEVLYRAVLMWYLMAWVPGSVAVAVSAVVFGAVHLYLGWGGVARATITGAVLGVVYLVTESLLLPIALHAMLDVASGFMCGTVLEQSALAASEGRDD